MSAEIAERETRESYTSPRERAAYRAGLSTAASICDLVAKDAEDSNRRGARVTTAGAALAAVARACANNIWAAREAVKIADNE